MPVRAFIIFYAALCRACFLCENTPSFLISFKDRSGIPVSLAIRDVLILFSASSKALSMRGPSGVFSTAFQWIMMAILSPLPLLAQAKFSHYLDSGRTRTEDLPMFEPFTDRRRRMEQLWTLQERLWRNVWLLFVAGVLLFLALLIFSLRLWWMLKSCHCVA
jgi:hypothetical protein